jgi:hypothetical protein
MIDSYQSNNDANSAVGVVKRFAQYSVQGLGAEPALSPTHRTCLSLPYFLAMAESTETSKSYESILQTNSSNKSIKIRF